MLTPCLGLQLSHYLDLVEMQLATQISQRSTRFFGAMSSQETLSGQVQEACMGIAAMRHKLSHVRCNIVKPNLQVLQCLQQRQSCFLVHQKLKILQAVSQTQATIQLLMATSDFVGALDLIATTQEVLRTDLEHFHCVRYGLLPRLLLSYSRLRCNSDRLSSPSPSPLL